MDEERLVSTKKTAEDEEQGINAPVNLRPTSLADFVGQKQVCENLKIFIEAAKSAARLWITSCCSARRVWEKQPWPRLLPKSSASAFAQLLRR